MRVLLADDHKLVRDALAFYCSRLADDVEDLQAETYDQAAEMAAQAASLDQIILDLNMPGVPASMVWIRCANAIRTRRSSYSRARSATKI